MAVWALWVLTAVLLLNGLIASALVWVLRDTKAGKGAITSTAVVALINFFAAGYCLATIALR